MRCLPERWPRVQRKWSRWVKCTVGDWGAFSTRSATTGKSVTSWLVRPSASTCPTRSLCARHWPSSCGGSGRDAEALAYVLRTFQFVEHRGSVVLERDEALSICVDKELVVGRAVLSGALARRNLRSRTQVGPVDALGFVAPNVERLASL